jgi:hypothetical protein
MINKILRNAGTCKNKNIAIGRNTPGKPQKNEGMDSWKQIDWMYNSKY